MPARRRSLEGLRESPMSPATARIHRHNINTSSQGAAAARGSEGATESSKQNTVISTPSFTAKPLFLPLTEEQVLSHAAQHVAPPSKRQRGQPASSASSSPPPRSSPPQPPASLVSSRGRHIKLREGSIHLQRREHRKRSDTAHTDEASPSQSPSPPPAVSDTRQTAAAESSSSRLSPSTVATEDAAEKDVNQSVVASESASTAPFSSPVYRSWVHEWCLWQMRCDYLLGEIRRRLSKREAGRASQSPHSGRKRARDKQSEQPERRNKRHSEAEEGKEEATEMKDESSEQTAAALSISSPDFVSSLIARIPHLHTQLTLPILDSLSIVSAVHVPPQPLHLPLLSALASCLLLPLPRPLSAVPVTAPQRPYRANYSLREAWRLPEQRIALQWAKAAESEGDNSTRTIESIGSTGRAVTVSGTVSSRSSDIQGRQATHGADRASKRDTVVRKQPAVESLQKRKRDEAPASRPLKAAASGNRDETNVSNQRSSNVTAVEQSVNQRVRKKVAVKREAEWMDEPSASEIREANKLSRLHRMEEREHREKARDARQLALPRSKQHFVQPIAQSNPNDVAAQAANELLASLTQTPR